MKILIKQLDHFSRKPELGSREYENWLEQDDFVRFLQGLPSSTNALLYASVSYYTFVYGVLVPDNWSCNPFSSWGITIAPGEEEKVFISPPLDHTDSKTLDQGEQIVYARQFDGRQEQRSYIEISQKLTHAFGLHWVPEREAYCRYDERGDVEEVIRVVDIPGQSALEGGRVVTILRGTLDEYLVITGQVLLLLYDSTRFDSKNFGGWQNQDVEYCEREPEIFFRMGRSGKIASYLRGIQIIRPTMTKEDLIKRYDIGETKERQYATFIAYDWKHGVVRECSCDPKLLGNYFVESDLPYQTSPVFFRPEVLQKYKADTDKYQLHDRSITCRHAWHLQTYDVNEAGQVHTYLIYLSYLPYEEQLYWKSFNEPRKGPISRRAFQTDFEGKWDHEYDPLQSLRRALAELDECHVPWWTLRGDNLLEKVHYPVTKAADEWAKELHALDKLLIEGFVIDNLRARAVSLGRAIDSRWKSLKLLEEVLIGLGSDEDQIREIVDPLRELNSLRSKISGHASGKEAERIKRDLLKKHKTYASHFRTLCIQCDRAIRTLRALVGSEHSGHDVTGG
jgi:hypothetical protein